jgi:hypothetical protein
MLRLAAIPVDDVQRLARPMLDPQRLVADPAARRGEIMRLQGRIRAIEAMPLSEDMARRFDVKQYYRAEMTLDDGEQPVVVYARAVPNEWRDGGTVDQPGSAWGVFVKLAADGGAPPRPAFAAARVAVYPADRLLGRLDMDVGLLDELADRRPLRAEERECFYQALAAAARAEPGQLRKEAARRLKEQGLACDSVVPLFNDPARSRGSLVMVSGVARRVLRLRVEEPDIQRRFGISHYYEVYLYTDDSQGNPLVFCVTHLPKDMPTGDGPDYGEPVTVAGFFLKSWAYPSSRTAESPDGKRPGPLQLAPLLVGRDVAWQKPAPAARTTVWGVGGAVVFVMLLLGVWLWLLRVSRTSRRVPRQPPNLSDMADRAGSPVRETAEFDGPFDFVKRDGNNSPDSEGKRG